MGGGHRSTNNSLSTRITAAKDKVLEGKQNIRAALASKGVVLPENPTFDQIVSSLTQLGDNVVYFQSDKPFNLTVTPAESVKETIEIGTNKAVVLTTSNAITYSATIDNEWWNGYNNVSLAPSQQVTGVALDFIPKYGFDISSNLKKFENYSAGFGSIYCCFVREGEPDKLYMLCGSGGVSSGAVIYRLLQFDLIALTVSKLWDYSDPYTASFSQYPDGLYIAETDSLYFTRVTDVSDNNLRYSVRKLDLNNLTITDIVVNGAYYITGSNNTRTAIYAFPYENSLYFPMRINSSGNIELYQFNLSTKAFTKPLSTYLPQGFMLNYDHTHYQSKDWVYNKKGYSKLSLNILVLYFDAMITSTITTNHLLKFGIAADNILMTYHKEGELNFIGTRLREPIITSGTTGGYINAPYKVDVDSLIPIGNGFVPNFLISFDFYFTPIANGFIYPFRNINGVQAEFRKLPLTYFG